MFLVISVSIGYSSFSTSLNITGLVTKVRLKQDIRITNLEVSNISNEGQSSYKEYNKENLSMGVYLSNSNSTVTYKVEVTNIGNVEMGLLSIEGLPENLEYELSEYNLKDKICDSSDSSKCTLGAIKEFYITIKYKENGYDSSETSYDINLNFTFKPTYNVTYTDIEVLDTYPSIVLETDTLEVDFGDNAPSSIEVLMSDAEIIEYTYSDGILSIPNVIGNIEIQKVEEQVTLAQYITNLYTPNSTVVNNSITYNVDTTNVIIDDGLGGTVSSGGNLRYYGANPNNYIDIGDRDSSGQIILWRIIGVFETKYATDELPCDTDSDSDGHYDNCASDKLVKIIRDESIGDYSWDYKVSSTTTSSTGNAFKATSLLKETMIELTAKDPIITDTDTYENDWSKATLQTLLNEIYYNSSTTSYYNGSSTAIEVNLTGEGLSSYVHDKVETVLWNLGGTSAYTSLYSNGWYSAERSTAVYSGRPTEWVGKIGLMYPSDYGYATDLRNCSQTLYNYSNSTSSYACRTSDWLFNSSISQFTLTPDSSSNIYGRVYVFGVNSSGNVYNDFVLGAYGARPVLYLKSDVNVVGEGTTSDGINYYVVD